MSQGFFKKFYSSKSYLLVGVVILVFVSFAFARAYYQNYQVRLEIKKMEELAASLEGKKFNLEKYLKYAQSDAFIEEKARTELNMVREGENVAIITGAEEEFARQNSIEVVQSTPVSNLRKWWQYFFNN